MDFDDLFTTLLSNCQEFIVEQTLQDFRKARSKRRRKTFRQLYYDAVELGRRSPIITNPTTKDSEYTLAKDGSEIRESQETLIARRDRLQKWRKLARKKRSRIIIDMKAGSFPPMSEQAEERAAHCRQAINEMNASKLAEARERAKRTLRVIRSLNS